MANDIEIEDTKATNAKKSREKCYSDGEKSDLADIICDSDEDDSGEVKIVCAAAK